MQVLVLGASGYIGGRVLAALQQQDWATPVAAARRPLNLAGVRSLVLDACDATALAQALVGIDCVVSCVAGGAGDIVGSTRALVQAAASRPGLRIVHFSSMAVYGSATGPVDEQAALRGDVGWYSAAKCEAEQLLAAYAAGGGEVVILRPGCVYGPGSDQWVGRIARLLQSRRLGDLGARGDACSNLVYIDDVVQAVLVALQKAELKGRAYNLAGQPSLRWNSYFVILGVALGATPVGRIGRRRLLLDAKVLSIIFKVLQLLSAKLKLRLPVPDPISPSLLNAWQRDIRLDAGAAERELGLRWTPVEAGVQASVAWLNKV